jgi:hypothetical protein
MIIYTWEFPRFKAHPELNGMQDVVYNVEYILTGTDGEGHGSQLFGNIGLGEPDLLTYVPFRLLTLPEVQKWVEESLGAEQVGDLKDIIANQINEQAHPKTNILDKPW